MNGEILNFLTPSVSHPIEVVFFSIILGGAIISLITSEVFGRSAAWQRNWQGGPRSAALDVEHGSISELSQAVATLAERIATNIPGLLLIFGLLGTFLGLGLALDKASSILQGSDDSLNAMSSSLGQLTGMMKDLGTKFKTSTWGIIAFIFLKLWESARWSAESRRLNWCLTWMKAHFDRERQERQAQRDEQQRQAREALEQAGNQIVASATEQGRILCEELKQLNAVQLKQGQVSQELTKHLLRGIKSLDERLNSQLQQLSGIADQGTRSTELLDQFVTSNRDNIHALQRAGDTMGEAAHEVASSARSLQQGVDDLGNRMNQVLGSIQADLNSTISRMNEDFSSNLQSMGSQLEYTIGHLGQVMNGIKSDLGQTIETMSEDFKRNTREMAGTLGETTREISSAITTLNENVGSVMTEVRETTVQANDMQKKTSVRFDETSKSLNEATVTMTEQMSQLGKEIKAGLSAVSKSGLQMQSIASKLQSFPELPQQFQVLAETSQAGVDAIGALRADLGQASQACTDLPGRVDHLSSIAAQTLKAIERTQQSVAELKKSSDDVQPRSHDLVPA